MVPFTSARGSNAMSSSTLGFPRPDSPQSEVSSSAVTSAASRGLHPPISAVVETMHDVLEGASGISRQRYPDLKFALRPPTCVLKTVERRRILKHLLREFGARPDFDVGQLISLIDALWGLNSFRDLLHVALDALAMYRTVWTSPASSDWAPALRDCLIRCVDTHPGTDTVDVLATQGFGELKKAHPSAVVQTLNEWARDSTGSVWRRRVALLHQRSYKEETDKGYLFAAVLYRCGDKDDIVRRAIGVALRSYRKVSPDTVGAFLEEHHSCLSALSLREARLER